MSERNRGGGWVGFSVAAAFLLLFVTVPVSAQVSTGTILGVVKDATGGTVAGAAITVINADTGLTRTSMSSEDGAYRFPALPVGNYEVRITKDGFETADRKGITLVVTQEAEIDFTLQVGATGQTVVVTEEAPQVNTTGSTVGGLVNEQKVQDLPLNGRNFVDLTLMQPGVASTQQSYNPQPVALGLTGTLFSSNGAPLHSNTQMLDGALMSTYLGLNASSIISTTLGVDGIKEYRVVTNLFSAEYGLTMGSQTVIVTKSGTNAFHGGAFDFLRNSSMDAANFFDTPISSGGKRLPEYQRNNFGGSFGGPFKKDKTFFFATYEGLRQGLGITTTTKTFPLGCFYDQNGVLQPTIPAQINNANPAGGCTATTGIVTLATGPGGSNFIQRFADLFPQPNSNINANGTPIAGTTFNYQFPFKQPSTENYGQMRVDQNISAADTMFARYTQDISDQTSARAYIQFKDQYHSDGQYITLSESHIISPTILNTFRYSFTRSVNNVNSNVDMSTYPNLYGPQYSLAAGQEIGSISPGGGITAWGPNSNPGSNLVRNINTFADDIFWSKGKHAFKIGTLVNLYQDALLQIFQFRGSTSFGSIANFFNADYSSLTQAIGNQTRDWRYTTMGGYIQDDYHVLPRLTLNLGLRYEMFTVPRELTGNGYSIRNILTDTTGTYGPMWINPSLHAFSPRVGFAWDPTGTGKTSIRGGGGIYYDIGGVGSLGVDNSVGTLPASSLVIINNSSATPAIPWSVPLPTGNASLTNPLPGQSVPAPRGDDYYMKQTSMAQYNMTIDRQLPWGMALTTSYVGSRGWHLHQIKEGNVTVPLGYLPNGVPYYCAVDVNPASTDPQCLLSSATVAGQTKQITVGTPPVTLTVPVPTSPANYLLRTNQAFGQFTFNTAAGDSWYNSLQTTLNKRITNGLQFQSTYTWGRMMDTGQGEQPAEPSASDQAPSQSFLDRGPSSWDIASNWKFNAIYHAPDVKWDKPGAMLLKGWWFGSIVSMQSGYPLTPTLSLNRSLQTNLQATDRPNLDPSFNKATAVTGNPAEWFNPTMFDLQTVGDLGNAPRGLLRGPGIKSLSLSFNKDTKVKWLGEEGALQFRAEIFNFLNHPNFGAPTASVFNPGGASGAIQCGAGLTLTKSTSPSCQLQQPGTLIPGTTTLNPMDANTVIGQISNTSSSSRQVQLALKVIF